ncbi:ATP-binding cassette domain-containing protein [Nocardia tengchongensis]
MRTTLDAKVRAAQGILDAASSRVRRDEHIHLDLPDPEVPRSRRIAELGGGDRRIVIQGPERVALIGPNGAGKSTLIEHLLAGRHPERGRLLTDRVGYLPQRLDNLDERAGALDNVHAVAATTAPGVIRNHLARLLIRGSSVERPVSTLSGGERFRVALARLLFADPPAQLLILDEPTNNLDIASVDQLVEALADYRGAILIVSHDYSFLHRIGVDTVVELDADGGMRRRDSL